jgi:hypothetical protein
MSFGFLGATALKMHIYLLVDPISLQLVGSIEGVIKT